MHQRAGLLWLGFGMVLVACGDSGGGDDDDGDDSPETDASVPPIDGSFVPPDGGPPPDLSCTLSGSVVDDDWGAAPAGGTTVACIEIENDVAMERNGEVAYSGVPIARGFNLTSTANLAVVGTGDVVVPAQFNVISRWSGVVDDTSLPIRWLQVSIPMDLAGDASASYAVRLYDSYTPPNDTMAASIAQNGDQYTVNTGTATFVLDGMVPGLFNSIDVRADTGDANDGLVYTRVANDGMGPRVDLGNGTRIDNSASSMGTLQLDTGAGLEVLESGPVKVVVVQRGHFVGDGGSTSCDPGEGFDTYESLGYTLVLTFSRGQRHVDAQFNFRNECSSLFSGPWTDTPVTIDRVSFELPLSFAGGGETVYYGADGAVTASTGNLVVEQRVGAGVTWQRRARVTQNGAEIATGTAYASPMAAVGNTSNAVATLQMPWMQYREPQAVAVEGTTLSARTISEEIIVGEARGIWGQFRVSFVPGDDVGGAADLESVRSEGQSAIERGLLVRASRETMNGAAIFPTLGNDSASLLRDRYVEFLNYTHDLTLSQQWSDTKNYGSQSWPDIPFLPTPPSDNPSNNTTEMNYWNASRVELLEFLRAGDPKWVWDWAMPQTWYQFFGAYLNAGEADHGNRNGFAATSGGCGWSSLNCCGEDPASPSGGCAGEDSYGHWNRSNEGSDDYSYTHGDVAYALRPNFPLLRRFAAAGTTVVNRYVDSPAEVDRGQFVSERIIARQVIQHFMVLANCAEFVPGAEGQACHDKLENIMLEFAVDNLSAGVLCQREYPNRAYPEFENTLADANPQTCIVPQQFMQNALMLHFFTRIYLNYGDVGNVLLNAITGSIWNYYVYGMGIPLDQRPDNIADTERPAIPTSDGAAWTNQLQYTLNEARTAIESCEPAPVNEIVDYDEITNDPVTCAIHPDTTELDPNFAEEMMILQNRPQTAGWLLVAHNLRPELGVCEVGKTALDTEAFLDLLDGYFDGTENGWLKGLAQIMQGIVFAIGAYDTCTD